MPLFEKNEKKDGLDGLAAEKSCLGEFALYTDSASNKDSILNRVSQNFEPSLI